MSRTQKTNNCRRLEQHLNPEFFKALAEPNRLQILVHLATTAKPHTVSELSTCCPVDVSVVSRHLKALKAAGILDSARSGKEVLYRVKAADVITRLRELADALEACHPEAECAFERD